MATVSPRLVATDYSRRGRGGAPRNFHVAAAAAPRLVHEPSASRPRRRDPLPARPPRTRTKETACDRYTKRGNTKQIEFCGELKVRAEQQLDEGAVDRVVLRCSGVARLGALDATATEHLSHLTVLDLQCNLLAAWAEVATVVAAAPSLQKLDVSGNRLRLEESDDLSPLSRLGHLAANGVGLAKWADVLRLGKAAPRLKVLHVARNAVCGDLEEGDAAAAFPELERLDVAATGLTDAAPLADLPALTELHATENPGLARLAGRFPTLDAFACSGCGFEEWASVDALNAACPLLKRLRFGRDNALTASLGASEARALLVARLPTVVHLNGASVSRKERAEAEKRYVRVAVAQISADRATPADHPRLEELKTLHGDPTTARATLGEKGGNLAAQLLELTLRCVAAEHCAKAPLTRKFPVAHPSRHYLSTSPPRDASLIFRRAFAAPPRPRAGSSVEQLRRRRGRQLDIPPSVAAPPRPPAG